ncbi:MAG: hypothetical protein ABH864_00625 [archaeon]
MNKTILALFSLILLSSFVSASYYIEASNDIHDYEDSMYLNPDFAPKADIFYTPFNAYRTYCDASYCPTVTKIVQIQEAPIQLKQPQVIVVKYPYQYSKPTQMTQHQIIRPITRIRAMPVAPICLN